MRSKNLKRYTLLVLFVLFAAYLFRTEQSTIVFVDGQVYTFDSNNSVARSALVVDGKIAATGSSEAMLTLAPKQARVVQLDGRALLPGFVDAHSHFPVGVIEHLGVDLSATSASPVVNNDELLKRVKRAIDETPPGRWVVGFSYDNTLFPDGQHPTRQQLDRLSQEHPVYLRHISGHMGVANSLALQELQVDNNVAPHNHFVGVDIKTGELNGLLQEHAAPSLEKFLRNFSYLEIITAYKKTQDEYLAEGITTAQNGIANQATTRLLRVLQRIGVLPMRVNAWVDHKVAQHSDPLESARYRQATVKLIVDGSPQGMTAYLSTPYFDTQSHSENFKGAPLYTQALLSARVLYFHKAGYQIALHGNGDAAIDMIIEAIDKAQTSHPRADARHILVHAQTIREDQILKLKTLPLTPSFFNSHTYYWGDWHREVTLGPRRAALISPLASAQKAGLRFSLHSDAPVTPVSPLHLAWSAVNRQTRSGFTLGEQQRIDLTSALRAITIDAAWQSHTDHDRGSIEAGKLADLIVLSEDPAAVKDLRTLKVDLTYIGGVEVYRRKR